MHTMLRHPRPVTQALNGAPAESQPMELWISHVLRTGVMIAAAVIGFGVLLLLIQGPGPGDPSSVAQLDARGSRAISLDPAIIWAGVRDFRAAGVIELGVLLLILTPVTRVGMTAVLFARQHDRIFVVITTVVLVVLVIGLLGFGS